MQAQVTSGTPPRSRVEIFSRAEFEAALPCLKGTTQPLWSALGVKHGEYCYTLPVKPGVLIQIRSSVKPNGFAAESGADSIRCFISDLDGNGMGSKDQRWITRVPGWGDRMKDVLRLLWKKGNRIVPCPKCSKLMKVFKTDGGENDGRWYMKCIPCNWWDSWLPEDK